MLGFREEMLKNVGEMRNNKELRFLSWRSTVGWEESKNTGGCIVFKIQEGIIYMVIPH